ncbi:His/Glu/Gln/Arg/opine family amino acid ABC transporter permease subunit [Enterococcus sp. PF1-24]|uniref:amino acid ABC transporter permease n=1 Tax=unclassified Enterococcus TaxID=2608891 RepID=UPI0024752ABC|nr:MULTISPECIES: amino acid ABC transporter permease [unclassified Enterococcus]MDH6363452.1 His/Glu/Gln/Arg/opine family amino acid ABC transporter permease subunit [Enterococcus sp. PFB1-1]MDH6400546.1 His/Glu/Gln/Arg/opine family amino acid ABC transporter permease subunit [Enterococcus sp. PF1-24]
MWDGKSRRLKWCLLITLVSGAFLWLDSSFTVAYGAEFNMHFDRILPYKNVYLNGLKSTLEITGISLIGGLFLGVVLALVKVSGIKILKWLSQFYTSIFRGTPLLVQVFIVYFATPQLTGYEIPAFTAAVIAFSLNSAAYISEILRGGIEAVDSGQMEAALSLGVSRVDALKDIIVPQALKTVLPALVNETIALLKESSLVSTIGMLDLMRSAQVAMNATYLAFEPFIVVAAIYYVLVMILNTFANFIERRLKRSDRY